MLEYFLLFKSTDVLPCPPNYGFSSISYPNFFLFPLISCLERHEISSYHVINLDQCTRQCRLMQSISLKRVDGVEHFSNVKFYQRAFAAIIFEIMVIYLKLIKENQFILAIIIAK